MRLFGLEITRAKALSPVYENRGWRSLIHEPFSGAWQRNIEVRTDTALTYSAVYACVTLIASDVAKLQLRLVLQDSDGIWNEVENPAWSPVLRKPNRYQTKIKFIENWMTSKLIHGNAYILKERDNRNVVTAMYVLDPTRTRPLVTDDGAVFYEVTRDNLTGQTDGTLIIPANEVIHDRMQALYHPLIGVSPIASCGISALHGLNIQQNSTAFFANGARPSGILSMVSLPNNSNEKAEEFQRRWDERYRDGGGGTAVLGGEWKFTPMTMTAVDTQLIEQLKMTAEQVCTAFKVPAHKVGVGPAPSYNNIGSLNQDYYSQCLQVHIEEIQAVLDDGLGLGLPHNKYGTEFVLEDLLLMDSATRADVAQKSLMGGGMSPDEVRKRYHGLGPVKGGQSPYLQQQNFSLSALDERDKNKPFAKPAAPPAGAQGATPEPKPGIEENANGGDDDERAIDLFEVNGVWQQRRQSVIDDGVQRALQYVRPAA